MNILENYFHFLVKNCLYFKLSLKWNDKQKWSMETGNDSSQNCADLIQYWIMILFNKVHFLTAFYV